MHFSEATLRAVNTAERNRRRMQFLGHTPNGDLLWTAEESRLLRLHYPDYPAAARAIPGRSRQALEKQAAKLGLVKPRNIWAPQEECLLKKVYRSSIPIGEIMLLFPGKSQQQIYAKAWRLKLNRPQIPLKSTGMALIDDIRNKARQLGFKMWEIDAETASGSYFLRPQYYNWRKISAALKFLGGKIVPIWPSK